MPWNRRGEHLDERGLADADRAVDRHVAQLDVAFGRNHHGRILMRTRKHVCDPAGGERDGDEAVGREEGRVDAREVSGAHDRVLVDERRRRRDDSGEEEPAASRLAATRRGAAPTMTA